MTAYWLSLLVAAADVASPLPLVAPTKPKAAEVAPTPELVPVVKPKSKPAAAKPSAAEPDLPLVSIPKGKEPASQPRNPYSREIVAAPAAVDAAPLNISQPVPTERWNAYRWIWIGTGVVTAVAAGAAIGTGVMANSRGDQADKERVQVKAATLLHEGETFSDVATAMWIVTAGLGVATTLFLVLDVTSPAGGTQVAVLPSTQGVVVSGRF